LAFAYDGVSVLKNISFELRPHEILAVIGPNGTGKSTLLKCIDGLLKPRKGDILLNGRSTRGMPRREMAEYIGYVPQTPSYIFPFTVLDMVLLGRYPHKKHKGKNLEKAYEALRLLDMENIAMRNFNEISGGQQQKVTIARAIAQEAEIFLLDEPTSNLDILHQLEVMELLRRFVREYDRSAVISMHDLNLTSRYADTVILLDQGKIVAAGEPFSVLTPENIAAIYHVAVEVKNIENRPHIIPVGPLL
jgi:iron complex transport system ATP-binding protein